jgi:hypothetical protein
MNDQEKTKEQLISELAELRQRIADLEKPGSGLTWKKGAIDEQAAFWIKSLTRYQTPSMSLMPPITR